MNDTEVIALQAPIEYTMNDNAELQHGRWAMIGIMAANKVVPGPKDDHYGEPKGTKFEKLYLKKKGWANKLKKTFKEGYG